MGNAEAEEIPLRGGLRFTDRRGELRGPERPKPVNGHAPAKAVPAHAAPEGERPTAPAPAPPAPPLAPAAAAPQPGGFEQAAGGLIESGMRFLESLAAVAQSAPDGEGLARLVTRDPRTNSPVLSIPLPQSVDQTRIMSAISAFVSAFGRPA